MTEKQNIFFLESEKIKAKGVFIIFNTHDGEGKKNISAFFSVFPLFNEI